MEFLKRNKIFLSKFSILFVVVTSLFFYAFSSGITGQTKKSTTDGCNCHGSSPTSSVNVSIQGPSSLIIGQNANYSVTISGGPLVRAGTNIAASAGTLGLVTGSGLQLTSGELTHTGPKAPVSGTVTFQFEYTAPSTPGNVTLFANGNSVNFNGGNNGDQWNFAVDKIIVVNTTSVDDNVIVNKFKLEQNYPNPFNPETKINYQLANSNHVSIKLHDLLGREIAVLVNEFKSEGKHEINFDATKYSLQSGVYYYRLDTEGFSPAKKLIYLK